MAFKDKAEKAMGGQTNPKIATALDKMGAGEEISCAKAERIALDLKVNMDEIGRTLDLRGIRIIQCQLGLFGFGERKKAVAPADVVSSKLRDAINADLAQGYLPCIDAWEIARQQGTARMTVASACEAMGIKIKPCQLGAF